MGTNVYNIAFDESQHIVIQSHRARIPDGHASVVNFEV